MRTGRTLTVSRKIGDPPTSRKLETPRTIGDPTKKLETPPLKKLETPRKIGDPQDQTPLGLTCKACWDTHPLPVNRMNDKQV